MRFLFAALALAACGPKKPPPGSVAGWYKEEGWTHACYVPPDYSKLMDTDRKKARGTTLDAMMSQWKGAKEDDVKFGDGPVEDAETAMLGRGETIEGVSQENLELCKKSATGGGTDAWSSWLRGLPDKLTAGECATHLDYTMYDYLDIGHDWQREMPMCAGDRVRITGTVKDRYRIADNAPWINVEGDRDQATTAGDWPCTGEGCYAGMLIGRLVTPDGNEEIFPIGTTKTWTVPTNGTFSYRINDTTFFDNTWFKTGAIVDHTAIEVSPAE
jgi:hypothetical protein